MKYAGLNTVISHICLFNSQSDSLMAQALCPSVLVERTKKNSPRADKNVRQLGLKVVAPAREPFFQRLHKAIESLFEHRDVYGQRQTDHQYKSTDTESRNSDAKQLELLEAQVRREERERIERFKYSGL